MSKLRLISAAIVAASLVAGTTVADAAKKPRTVKIGDNWIYKDVEKTKTVTIRSGSKIKWKWVGYEEHNLRLLSAPIPKSKRGPFKASARQTGTKTKKFTVVGKYKFYCSIHDASYDRQRVIIKVKPRS